MGMNNTNTKQNAANRLTPEICRAAGQDAANTNMRKGGRSAWNEEDHGIACRECNRLWDIMDANR